MSKNMIIAAVVEQVSVRKSAAELSIGYHGETFQGWTAVGSSTGAYQPGMIVMHDLDLYGVWETNDPKEMNPQQSVVYLYSEGERVITTAAYNGGETVLPTPSRAGYDFAGWYEDWEFTGTRYAAGETYTVDGFAILYAKWTY